MNEGREMKDGVGIQKVKLYVVIVQKTMEERTSRRTKSVFNKRDE
jgi:hypothetical protein